MISWAVCCWAGFKGVHVEDVPSPEKFCRWTAYRVVSSGSVRMAWGARKTAMTRMTPVRTSRPTSSPISFFRVM